MSTRLRVFLVALVTVANSVLGGAVAAHTQSASVQARVNAIFQRWSRSTPGCAVDAAVNGRPVVSSAYGMADLEHDVPIAVDTIFEAGSVSKQFTAAAVLLLAISKPFRDG